MAGPSIELRAGAARARIALRGAELKAWDVGDTPWLWPGDPASWDESAPVLFPVVGWTRDGEARVGGQTYPLGLHGFARFQAFEAAGAREDEARFVLRETPATLEQFPFRFELGVTYRLFPDGLSVAFDVVNTGDRPMPYAIGFHPGFRLPLGGGPDSPLAVVFDAEEEKTVPVIAPGGLFSPERRAIPLDGRRLPLDAGTFATQSLCFVDARSRGLVLTPAQGRALRFDFEDLPTIVLWRRPEAPFLCVEGWTGRGDPVGFAGDLFEKPGMRVLEPGQSTSHRMTVRIVEPLDGTTS
ncbi:aldose 1-epimerase family protein [uncultured Alsobacter sp.]|uniref:aldose epimerase family protein n=1 Tax=uncultured Alsobacter sp. TaxID=1748258 RepID=UPI0025F05419|nr:aldose 1-epimerase family protein [uncultured Alsobacter sp.]